MLKPCQNVLMEILQFEAIFRTCNIKPFSASGGCAPRPLLLGSPTTSISGHGITILLVMPLLAKQYKNLFCRKTALNGDFHDVIYYLLC